MKKTIFFVTLFAFLLFFSNESSAQNALNDSIQKILISGIHDTTKISKLIDFSWSIRSKDPDLALKGIEKAIELSKNTGFWIGLAKAYKTGGNIIYFQSNYLKALDYYNSALEAYTRIGDKQGMAAVYRNFGSIYYQQGLYSKSLENLYKSLKIREELQDSKGIAISNNAIGLVFLEQGDENLESAKKYFNKSLKISIILKDNNSVANNYYCLGAVFNKMRDKDNNFDTLFSDSALYYFKKSKDIYEKEGNKRQLAALNEALGLAYIKRKEPDKAIVFFNKSLEYRIETKNKFGMANLYNYLADYYNLKGLYSQSVLSALKAVEIANEIEAPPLLVYSYNNLSTSYELLGDYKNALKYKNLYQQEKEKLFNEEKTKELARLEMKSEYEKKESQLLFEQEKRNLENKAKLKQQKYYTYGALVGLVLIMGVLFLIVRNSQQRKRANILLTEKNAEITVKNELLQNQKEEIAHKNKQITDSIIYAKRIQNAVLPPEDLFSQLPFETFILYRPKDIVSGDFYWINRVENKIVFLVADCTGHGVPGAIMSMLGISLLNEISVNLHLRNSVFDASCILNELRTSLKKSLHQTGKKDEPKDGMDMACCVFETGTDFIDYAGAYNSAFHVRNGEITEYKADKMPIAVHFRDEEKFTNHKIEIQKGDTLYLSSDGFVDQFGGPDKKKFLVKNFRKLLAEIADLPIIEQQNKLASTLLDWMSHKDEKGRNFEQIDDITVMGIKF